MSEILASTLTVTFDESSEGKGLALERHYGFTGMRRGIPFRLYPKVPAKLICSYGKISMTPEYRESDEKETVVFSGSATASLKKPQATSVMVTVLSDVAFDVNGDVVYPKVEFDSDKELLVSNIGFYGAVEVTYKAGYSLHFYQFKIDTNPATGATILYGDDTIHAFYKKNHAELKMDASFKMESQWRPFYKVTSKVVLDEFGVWEYPSNWEGADSANFSKKQDDPSRTDRSDGVFGGGYTSHTIDPDLSFTDTRVHQMGEYDFMGRIKTSTPNDILGIQEPYWEHYNSFESLARDGYLQFHLEIASRPTWKQSMSYSERLWMGAWASVDMDEIRKELKEDYPGIKEGNKAL